MRSVRVCLLRASSIVAVGIALSSSPLVGQGHPIGARGFSGQSAFASDGIDSVNLFSRNLLLTIPIGQRYPVGPGFSYGFTLYYNSNVWDLNVVKGCNADSTPCVRAEPGASFNAGLGWTLGLGRLLSPTDAENESDLWLYIGPDSSRHYFYDTLHEGETVTGCGSGCQMKYTRDGTYLRLKTGSTPTVEFPSGEKHTFGGLGGALTRMDDQFGSWVDVNVGANSWALSDRHGRNQTVSFTTSAGKKVVSSITLTAFNGNSTTYAFTYNPTTVYRPYMDSDDFNSDTVQVPLLYDINVTSTAGGSLNYSMWQAGAPSYFTGSLGTSDPTGILRRIVLPTKGTIEWTFNQTHYPVSGDWTHFENGFGVATKQTGNPWGSGGTWNYTTVIDTAPTPDELVTTVEDPENGETTTYFSVPTTVSTSGWTGWEYGLPFTTRVTSGGRFLSSQFRNSSGGLVRSRYLSYTHDKLPSTTAPADWYNTNRRVSGTRTLFNDDGGKYFDQGLSDFDGTGNFRTASSQDNFDGTVSKSATTKFNPARGCYDIVHATNSQTCNGPNAFVQFASTDPWVLGTFSFTEQSDGGTAKQEYEFTSAGFLNCKRLLKTGTSRGTHDLVVTYQNNGFGFNSFEKYWGGDNQTLGTGSVCSTVSAPDYWISHGYTSGVRSSSRFKTSGGADMNFLSLSQTIDANTGLPRHTYDPSEYWTRLTFDGLGRPTLVEPIGSVGTESEAKTTFAYSNAGGSAAKVNISRSCPTGVSGCSGSFGESEVHFDGFGRPWKELVRQSNGSTWSRRETSYNALGWRTGVSETGANSGSLSWNNLSQFDALGRPGRLTKADGKIVDFGYAGAREISRTSKVYTTVGSAETSSTTTERYDPYGRLRKVFEPAMPDGSNVNTIYEYDVLGNLSHVDQVAGSTHQHRYFTFDNRGFLNSETHPEKGSGAGGSIFYLNIDALGNPTEVRDGANAAVNGVLLDYDSAARLLTVTEAGAGGRPLKAFTYGSSGNGRARIATAVRHNYLPAPLSTDYIVTETYAYNGVGRRTSYRRTDTDYFSGPKAYFEQSWTYDRGGNITTLDYPRCFTNGCPAGGTPARVVNQTYSNGWLTAIPGWANTIGYHLNGMLNAVGFANNISQLVWNDPDDMTRPYDISFQVTSSGANIGSLGPLLYDGSGNIKNLNNLNITYDAASRIKSGSVYVVGVATPYSAAYDGFGNITSLTQNGSARSTPTSTSTNRLTAGSYDVAGNLTSWNGASFAYDRLSMPARITNGAEDWTFAYTADDERILEYRLAGGNWKTAIRNLDGKILREFWVDAGWSSEDFIYRDGTLLASVSPAEGTRFFGPDHLGTPRAVFSSTGSLIGLHTYYPYGEEATASTQDSQQMKFTGHERNLLNSSGNPSDDTDYMHARQYSPISGRFLSTDPFGGNPHSGQSWNRYSYVIGNPLRYVDPTGMNKDSCTVSGECPAGNVEDELTVTGEPPPNVPEINIFDQPFGPYNGVNFFQVPRTGRGSLGGLGLLPITGRLTEAALVLVDTLLTTYDQLLAPSQEESCIETTRGTFCGKNTIAMMPMGPARLGHIFRRALGHVAPSTAASQARFLQLFADVASDKSNLRPSSLLPSARANAGVQLYTRNYSHGQVWVEVLDGTIVNAGINPAGAFR